MKRIHPDYGTAIVEAFSAGGKESSERKFDEAVNYWTDVLAETIGAVTLGDIVIIKDAFDRVINNLYKHIKPEQVVKAMMLLRTAENADRTEGGTQKL